MGAERMTPQVCGGIAMAWEGCDTDISPRERV